MKYSEFKRGIQEAFPMIVGFIPFGLILGTQATKKQMTDIEVLLMTMFNYAGGSEFAAIGLWQLPPPMLLIILTTLMINSRHILMGATLSPYIRHLPARTFMPVLFFMCDEAWAMAMGDIRKNKRFIVEYYFGVALSLYVIWFISGYLGAVIGGHLGNLEHFGFTLVLPAVFIVLLKGMWQGRAQSALPWAVSLCVACGVYLLFPKTVWYIVMGTAAGVVTALLQDDKQ